MNDKPFFNLLHHPVALGPNDEEDIEEDLDAEPLDEEDDTLLEDEFAEEIDIEEIEEEEEALVSTFDVDEDAEVIEDSGYDIEEEDDDTFDLYDDDEDYYDDDDDDDFYEDEYEF